MKRDLRREVAALRSMIRDGSEQSLGQALELIRAGASANLHAKLLEGCRLVDGVPSFGPFFDGPAQSAEDFQSAFLCTLGTLPPETGCGASLRRPARLDLSGWRPRVWPDGLSALSDLEHLVLDGCLDSELPSFVAALPKLKRLSIRGARFRTLPDGLGDTSLTHLDARDTPLRRLPASLFRAPLLELDLRGAPLEALPTELGTCVTLRLLRIRSAPLTSLPATIGALSALATLEVSRGQLAQLPPSIGELRALRTLVLDDNALAELPDAIGELSALEELGVERNALARLPPVLSQLPSLRKLRADFNKLRSLDGVVPPSLRLLSVRGNPIEQLPQIAFEASLRHLDARHCPLDPATLEALEARTGTTLV